MRISPCLLIVAALSLAGAAAAQDRDLIVEPPAGGGALDPYDLIRAENPLQEFVVTLATESGASRAVEGETVRFAIRSDRAGYVTLLNKNPEGTVTFLYPNRFSQSTRIEPGRTVYFPASEREFRIRVSAPFGQEYVKAIVTPEPLVDEAVAQQAWGERALIVVEGAPEGDGGSDLGGFDPGQWATASLTLDTVPSDPVAEAPEVPVPTAPPPRYSDDPIARWESERNDLLGVDASRSFAASSAPVADEGSADEIVVIYRPDAGTRAFGSALGRGGAFGSVRVVPADASALNIAGSRALGDYGQTVEEQVAGLNEDPDVLVAFPNLPVYSHDLPEAARTVAPEAVPASSPPGAPRYWELQWALHNGFYRTDADRYDVGWLGALRAYRPAAEPLVVAVLDSGVHLDHPALQSVLWKNEQEIPGNGRDDDANGYVDDYDGWDAYADDGDPSDPDRSNSHGTFVASEIAYDPDAQDVYGLAPNVLVMPVRVLGPNSRTDSVIEGIEYAARNGADVINMSLGTRPIPRRVAEMEIGYRAIFEAAERHGVLIVMAAGNHAADSRTSYTYPAVVDAANAMTVAALDIDGQLASYSNRGPAVHLAAPGSRILGYPTDGRAVESWNGTSMAAPYAAAAAAMLWSQNPRWGPADVKDRLVRSVSPVSGLDVRSGGTLNLDAALGR